jgi:hypothetical protein
MALKFKNIRSKEIIVAQSEPMIAALWASSNLGPNAHQGQDFGWRLAPEVVIEMKRIKNDYRKLESIAVSRKKSVEELKDSDILRYISKQTLEEDAPIAQEGDYEEEYLAEISALERKSKKEAAKDS